MTANFTDLPQLSNRRVTGFAPVKSVNFSSVCLSAPGQTSSTTVRLKICAANAQACDAVQEFTTASERELRVVGHGQRRRKESGCTQDIRGRPGAPRKSA